MAFSKQSPPLSASMFGTAEIEKLQEKRSSKIKVRALATLFEGDFDVFPTAEEENFMRANLALVDSGNDFERIFLLTSDAYVSSLQRPSFALQAKKNSRIHGRVVFLETLQKQDPELLHKVEHGFLVFGDEVAFVDLPSSDKFSRGFIVTHPDRLRDMHQLYEQLRTYSYPLSTSKHPATGEMI
jgi:hypothetical protein